VIRDDSYGAAAAVAPAVYAHFDHHIAAARDAGESRLGQLAPAALVSDMIATAFWASLRREEGHPPKISLAYVGAPDVLHPLVFGHPLAFEPGVLTKLALAVERPGIHLGVTGVGDGLAIWGTTRDLPRCALVIEVAEPGLLVIKEYRGDGLAKYVNVAVLEGDQVKVIDENASSLPDCPELLTSLLGFDSPASWGGSINVLVQLALSMRAHRKGGVLLVVPPDSDAWSESVVRPITYAVAPRWSELAVLARHQWAEISREPLRRGQGGGVADATRESIGEDTAEHGAWRDALARAIDAVGGLTAVDGATVITRDYDVLAFGAKIARRRGSAPVEQVVVTEPIEGSVASTVHPAELGGTRHLSAAQFVFDQRDAVALVASQDGRFTVFAWSPCEQSVHAHRVETLLL
jgi:hypothetical protein